MCESPWKAHRSNSPVEHKRLDHSYQCDVVILIEALLRVIFVHDISLNLVGCRVDSLVGYRQVVFARNHRHIRQIGIEALVEAMCSGKRPLFTNDYTAAENTVDVQRNKCQYRRELVQCRVFAIVNSRLQIEI